MRSNPSPPNLPRRGRVRQSGPGRGTPENPVTPSASFKGRTRGLPLTEIGNSLKFSLKSVSVPSAATQGPVMSEETPDSLETARLKKLRRIEALGLDPWGRRFDDHRAIDDVRRIALPEPKEGEQAPREEAHPARLDAAPEQVRKGRQESRGDRGRQAGRGLGMDLDPRSPGYLRDRIGQLDEPGLVRAANRAEWR